MLFEIKRNCYSVQYFHVETLFLHETMTTNYSER